MDPAENVRQFESGELAEFHHEDHVRTAWSYLQVYPVLEGLRRFTVALQRFAAARNQSGLYHETITWAYVLLIHERMKRCGSGETWEAFASRNPDLLDWKNGILKAMYREKTLQSDLARRVFLLPDKGLVASE
jgi:hypothetical protein